MGDPYPYGIPDFGQLGITTTDDDLPDQHPPPCNLSAYGEDDVVFPAQGFRFSTSSSSNSTSRHHQFNNVPTTNPIVTTTINNNTSASHGFFVEEANNNSQNLMGWLGFDATANNNRWPRQETLSLLEIRSRLDSNFRHTNHKAPLWNQISRLMREEYGYERSGKKCKEKFENLYKYYKKTKEGKTGRHDNGKHYRFFRQLEAICGEATLITTPKSSLQAHNNNINPHHHYPPNHALPNTTTTSPIITSMRDQFETTTTTTTSSSENNNNNNNVVEDVLDLDAFMVMKQKGIDQDDDDDDGRYFGKRVEEIVESHMKKIMKNQEAWMEKMMSVVEQREQEMALKEEERKKKKRDSMMMRLQRQQVMHELWAKERAWIQTRDNAFMEIMRSSKLQE